MSKEKVGVGISAESTAVRNKDVDQIGLGLSDTFVVECYSADGELKWVDTVHNAVTNEGLNYVMDVVFYGGATQYVENIDWRVGLVDINPVDPTFTDTAAAIATSVMTVAEYTTYDEASRPLLNLDAAASASAGSVTNSNGAPAVFTISTPGTDVGGCFIVAGTGSATKGGNVTPGVLYGAGAFTAGNKVVDTGDTLNVTVNVAAASA